MMIMYFFDLLFYKGKKGADFSNTQRHMTSDVSVFACYSQVGKWWQVFEGSFWYQWYVITVKRPKKTWLKQDEIQ